LTPRTGRPQNRGAFDDHPTVPIGRPPRRTVRGGTDTDRTAPGLVTPSSPGSPSRRTVAVVLAGGLGTRMRSRVPKVLHPLCGRPMIEYVVEAATSATGSRPIVVVSPATEAVREVVSASADTALQASPLGTGDALRTALDALPDGAEEVLVVSGDVPLVRADLLASLLEARALDHAAMSLVAVDAIDPTGLGRVLRNDGGTVERVVEDRDATDDERQVSEINAGLYALDAAWLRRRIRDLRPSPTTGELYLTDLVAFAREDGRIVAALDVEDDGRLTGINDRAQLARAEWDLRVDLNDRWMRAGVTMIDPSTVYLDHAVELAEDVVLEPGVVLRGQTRIGERTRVATGSQVVDSTIGADCVVWASVVESSVVEDEVTIGPFSHLRPGTHVGRRSEIGNFAELKNARLGEHVRQHHMSYLGDADVGADTNVGAGTITANYDGVRKHRTTIGEGVFLGVDTMLRAPIVLGDGAKTGAGAVVTKDVPAGKLAVGVPARIREPRPPAAPDAEGEGAGSPATAADEPVANPDGTVAREVDATAAEAGDGSGAG
jgi:bifunctional UDP-N-acetylglucosamine pyrophosphorylase/glucosamine-1-phosphate N-acetyltransferase